MKHTFAAAMISLAATLPGVGYAEESGEFYVTWAPDGPNLITQSYEFECQNRKHVFVFIKQDRNKFELTRLQIGDEVAPVNIVGGVRDLMAKFEHIETVNFTCGGYYDGPHASEEYGRDFRGQIHVAFHGTSAEEPMDSDHICHSQGGVFLEEVLGTITFSSDRVVETNEPDLGICVFGVTSVEIKRPRKPGNDL